MEDQIVRLVEVKDALFSTFNQIEDYLTENIPVDANPIFLSTGQDKMDSRLYNIQKRCRHTYGGQVKKPNRR